MNPVVNRTDVERFRALVARSLGLSFDDGKTDHLADVLRARMAEMRCDHADTYLSLLISSEGREECRTLAEELTVTETYFFRYLDHFRAFSEAVLSGCVRSHEQRGELRILSAGCASGEEAYSLAILARERLPKGSLRVNITAIDVNRSMIQKAANGRYSAWSLREAPADFRDRYFKADGRDFRLDETIRRAVTFEERNLLDEEAVLWQECAWDVVFCRNVVMYFCPEVTRRVIARIARSLRPDGYLFLGHAETLRGISDEFHLLHTHGTFYYQRKAGRGTLAVPDVDEGVSWLDPGANPLLIPQNPDTSWVAAIHKASERIASLAAAGPSKPPESGHVPSVAKFSVAASRGPSDLSAALDLMRRERFREAMDFLGGQESGKDPEVLLLRAVILTNSGDIPKAEQACRDLLDSDELNAGAHYLMALCREHLGDRKASMDHDQTAVYLDSAFAMPHLHLGILTKKDGDLESARRRLQQALALLPREDSTRILFFGGGFGREALIEFCRAELRACGGQP